MARRIEGPYDFSRYNFATYADGATWELDEGSDFTVTIGTIVSNARRWAATEGLEVDTKVIESTKKGTPNRVALRFREVLSNVHKIAQ
jgi:hypothetical protein